MFTKSTIVAVAALMAANSANAQAATTGPGVTPTGTMGETNPPQATMGTGWNSTSMSRLVTLNSVDDFCLFGPPEAGAANTIGETEAIEVAWCTQPRNNARQLPLDKVYSAHFVKTPLYVQISGYADLTSINIPMGDYGGELDPHGATGLGNPVGGNVTTNVSGSDTSFEEWMMYVSYQQFCFRICTAENSTYSAAQECQHTLDEMGCDWVMPGVNPNNSFTECDADSAYPPGLYPQADGSTSTFAQRYTGSYTNEGTIAYWTVGQTVTPQSAYSTPSSSNCQTFTNINNAVATTGSSSSTMTGSASSSMMTSKSGASSGSAAASTGGAASSVRSAASSGASSAASSSSAALGGMRASLDGYAGLLTAGASAFALIAGAGAFML